MKLLPIFCISLLLTVSCTKLMTLNFDKESVVHIIVSCNTNEFNKLLSSGYDINAPISGGDSAPVFYAYTPQMFDYLVANGANPHQQNLAGEMPIESFYRLGAFDIVSHIAAHYPYSNTNNICGYPQQLLQYIFKPEVMKSGRIYISINDKKPPPALMNWLKKKNEKVIACSINNKTGTVLVGSETYSKAQWHDFRYKSNKDAFGCFNICIKKTSEKEWSFSAAYSSGMLSGLYIEGLFRYIDEYKQWIVIQTRALLS